MIVIGLGALWTIFYAAFLVYGIKAAIAWRARCALDAVNLAAIALAAGTIATAAGGLYLILALR